MSLFTRTPVGDFTRGTQSYLHRLRMLKQNFVAISLVAGVLFLLISVSMLFATTTPLERYLAVKWVYSWSLTVFLPFNEALVYVEIPQWEAGTYPAKSIATHEIFLTGASYFGSQLLVSALSGIGAFLALAAVLMLFFYRVGRKQSSDEFVRGGELARPADVSRQVLAADGGGGVTGLFRFSYKHITIASVPLPRASETTHTLVMGSPGTGKSVTFREMLHGVRGRRQRAIVYDHSGDFIEEFFRPDRDVILNPFDQRCPAWDPWCECKFDHDYMRLASSLIPDTGSDPFWSLAARIVFVEVCKKVALLPHPKISDLINYLLVVSLEEMIAYLRDTEAIALFAQEGAKMAMSIRASLIVHARALRYLPTQGPKFSISDWIAASDSDDDGWIFIASKADHRDSIRSLLTVWLNTAATSILSLPPDRNRRIWFFIDELPSLHKFPELSTTLNECRKFGGCGVIGFQSLAQLHHLYGHEEAEAITGACTTRVVFRCNEAKLAEMASNNIGHAESIETSEGISIGANDMRDGLSLSNARQIRPLVLPTEISNLSDLRGYLILSRGLPVTVFNATYQPVQAIAEPFIERPNLEFHAVQLPLQFPEEPPEFADVESPPPPDPPYYGETPA